MIDILLSTYNGERFLREQIDSLLAQTYQNWRILVRDDGSTDNTRLILQEYCQRFPKQIIFADYDSRNLGTCQSFDRLLSLSNAPYIMFCDQDDVWLPHKIEITLRRMQSVERSSAPDTGIVVHTDAIVVDEHLRTLSNSLWEFQAIKPELKTLSRVVMQNIITGNTLMINRKMGDIVSSIPSHAIMHDWWIALTASTFGVIEYSPEKTILYRQHTTNEVGAKAYGLDYIRSCIMDLQKVRGAINKILIQGACFFEKYHSQLTAEQCKILFCLSELPKYGFLRKRVVILKYKFFKNTFFKTLGFLAVI